MKREKETTEKNPTETKKKTIIYSVLTSLVLGILIAVLLGLSVLAFSYLFIGTVEIFIEIFLRWIWVYILIPTAVFFIYFTVKTSKK